MTGKNEFIGVRMSLDEVNLLMAIKKKTSWSFSQILRIGLSKIDLKDEELKQEIIKYQQRIKAEKLRDKVIEDWMEYPDVIIMRN